MEEFEKYINEELEVDWREERYDKIIEYTIDFEYGILVDKVKHTFCIYRIFPYSDDFKSNTIDFCDDLDLDDDLLTNESTFVNQKSFEIFVSKNSNDLISTWDDDFGGMCPGFSSYVGFYNISFDTSKINEFMSLAGAYDETLKNYTGKKEYIINEYMKKNCTPNGKTICESTDFSFRIFNQEILHGYSKVDKFYEGKEFFLILCEDEQYATDMENYNIAIKYYEEWEYCTEIYYFTNKNELIICNGFVYTSIVINKDLHKRESMIEEAFVISAISDFMPFASNKLNTAFNNTYFDNVEKIISEDKSVPIIITEGSTDWRHLQRAWSILKTKPDVKNKYGDLKFKIFEYEPENSSVDSINKIHMDCNELVAMCTSYSKTAIGNKYIFIADRDVKPIVKQVSTSTNSNFKSWGNEVYSFALPIPKHRKETPEICIEHYYSDEELKTIKLCEDGKYRRLYLSNEFDKYGRAPEINKFCINRTACKKESIKILDGSGDDRVISFNDITDETNYALSKMSFANAIYNAEENFDNISFDNFLLVFDVIKEIIDYINLNSKDN